MGTATGIIKALNSGVKHLAVKRFTLRYPEQKLKLVGDGYQFDPTTGDRTASKSGISSARKYLTKRFPGMKDAPLLESRVCQYENSPDGHYIIDRHPEAENTWVLGGGSGHGFKLGPALGEFVANRVIGKKEVDPFFALSRFNNNLKKKTQFNSFLPGSN